jgi:hypothetical protein
MIISRQFIPPEYGSQPIPEGALRFNHYTHPDAVEGIQNEGILRSKSEEKFSRGGTESPQVFATAGQVKGSLLQDRPVVEGWARPEQLDIGRGNPPQNTEAGRHVITFQGDVPRDQILAIHEPWHDHARYMENEPGVLRRVLAGEHDDLLDFPGYGPAIQYIKRKHGVPPR